MMPLEGELPEAMETLLAHVLDGWGVPGGCMVAVEDDEILFCVTHGVKDTLTREPVTPDSLFAIASVTKAFTTAGMAMLADEGKLDWDDPVRKHLPWFRLADPLADAHVTLRDLVTHRTGLSRNDMLWYKSPWGREEIVRKIGRVALNRSFRSTYQYNNIMFMAAGLVIEAITGMSWEEFVRQRLFQPLGMRTANFSTEGERAPDRARPHRRSDEGVTAPIPWLQFDAEGPGGTINASGREMASWLRFQLAGGEIDGRRLVSEKNLRETHAPQMVVRPEGMELEQAEWQETTQQSYAMGWSVWDYRGHAVLSHGGAIDGFRSTLLLVPRERFGIGVFVNLGPTNAHVAARNLAFDVMHGLQEKDWTGLLREQFDRSQAEEAQQKAEREAKRHRDTRPSREREAYVGAYVETAYDRASVSLDDGRLVLRWSTFTVPLEHWHYDTFRGKDLDEGIECEVQFQLDGAGEVSSLRLLGQTFQRA